MTERQLQAAVLELARVLGFRAYHTFDSRRSEPGFPDLTLVKQRRLIFAELKSATGKLRPEQRDWLSVLAQSAEVFVWRPEDWTSGLIERTLAGPP